MSKGVFSPAIEEIAPLLWAQEPEQKPYKSEQMKTYGNEVNYDKICVQLMLLRNFTNKYSLFSILLEAIYWQYW